MIISHEHPAYILKWKNAKHNRFNGAYYYSKEIVDNIIPLVHTDRNWVTIQVIGACVPHSIVFIHNNLHPESYQWLSSYDDLILVCGIPETVEKVSHIGHAIYLPLSIDVPYVTQFKCEKTKDTAYVGRKDKRLKYIFEDVDYLEGIPRDELLKKMAEYKHIYAVGRCALEGLALGCDILPYDDRFPDPSIWKVLDNRDAAYILQEKLDEIDGKVMK